MKYEINFLTNLFFPTLSLCKLKSWWIVLFITDEDLSDWTHLDDQVPPTSSLPATYSSGTQFHVPIPDNNGQAETKPVKSPKSTSPKSKSNPIDFSSSKQEIVDSPAASPMSKYVSLSNLHSSIGDLSSSNSGKPSKFMSAFKTSFKKLNVSMKPLGTSPSTSSASASCSRCRSVSF